MKMDIEVYEFIVFPDLVVQGSLCNAVDSVFGEFHFWPRLFPLTFPDHNITLDKVDDAIHYTKSLIRALHASLDCRTVFTMGDDESYYMDSVPWPTPLINHALPQKMEE
jgi:hypothetical protein